MTTTVGGSTRWCPTPEQLMILEEMYRGGLRTPNAAQIQQITAHLSNYGRIEGKNVFYWFQNHKARDRQKLRRRLCMTHHLLSCAHYYHHTTTVVPPPTMHHYYGALHQHQQQQLLPTTVSAAAGSYCYPANPLFQYQGAAPEHSLGRLQGNLQDQSSDVTTSTYELPTSMEEAMAASTTTMGFCRPLKTLDLFPGALKEEHRDVI